MNIGCCQPLFEFTFVSEPGKTNVRVVRRNGVLHVLRPIASNCKTKDDAGATQPSRQLDERAVGMCAPKVARIQQTEFRLAEQSAPHFSITRRGFSTLAQCPRSQGELTRSRSVRLQASPHTRAYVHQQIAARIGAAHGESQGIGQALNASRQRVLLLASDRLWNGLVRFVPAQRAPCPVEFM